FSYGSAAIIVAGLGFAAWWMKKGLAVFCVGMLLLLGGMTFFLQITSWEPTWLKMALEGGEDFQHCYHLEVAYSIPDAVVRSPARPEILFARAVVYQSRGLTEEALFYYGQAADGADPQLRRVALLEKARLASHYAATLYKQGGIGAACRYWLVSIEAAPDKLNGFFGAGRAFNDMADYSTAIKYFEPVFHKTSQPALVADMEDDLGACWSKLSHTDVARTYHIAFRKTDHALNSPSPT